MAPCSSPRARLILFVVVMVFLVIALGLQIAGMATLGWVVTYVSTTTQLGFAEDKVYAGLWETKAMLCFDRKCREYEIDESELTGGFKKIADSKTEYKAETCIAVVFLVIGMLTFVFSHPTRCLPHRGKIIWVTIACLLISAILAIVPVAQAGKDLQSLHDELGRFSPLLTPYSLYLTGIGGILAFIMALVLLLVVQPWRNDPSPRPAHEMSYVTESPGPRSAKYVGPQYTETPGQRSAPVYVERSDPVYVERSAPVYVERSAPVATRVERSANVYSQQPVHVSARIAPNQSQSSASYIDQSGRHYVYARRY